MSNIKTLNRMLDIIKTENNPISGKIVVVRGDEHTTDSELIQADMAEVFSNPSLLDKHGAIFIPDVLDSLMGHGPRAERQNRHQVMQDILFGRIVATIITCLPKDKVCSSHILNKCIQI